VGKVVSVMARQLGHLIRLVDDLLDVSRIRLGKVELEQALQVGPGREQGLQR
jgi:signal transduction histidine kinase